MRRKVSPRVFMLAATLAACGASTDLDERPPARPCTDEPPAVSLHLARTSEGAALHWDVRGGCIATTYDPSIADRVGEVRAALDAWRSPCSDLCFSAPVVSSTPPGTGERRVHFSRRGERRAATHPVHRFNQPRRFKPDTRGSKGRVAQLVG
jgi:hypothetical protein